jgi:hypothetical protein
VFAHPWSGALTLQRGSGGALQVILCGSPVPGKQLVETAVWPEIDEMEENIGKVPVRVYAAELGGLDQRSHDGPVLRAVIVAGEECVLARKNLRAHRAFDDVGIEISAAVIEEAGQALPVLERITDGLRDGGFGRHPAELSLEEAFERVAMWRGLLAAYGASLLGALASDGLLDPVECGNAHERLRGNGGVAFPGDLEEAAPDVGPAEGERDRIVW